METLAGKITHYYNHLGVAVVEFCAEVKVGDTIHIIGHSTDFTQTISSMEIEHKKVLSVQAGMEAALKVTEPVRGGDEIFLVSGD